MVAVVVGGSGYLGAQLVRQLLHGSDAGDGPLAASRRYLGVRLVRVVDVQPPPSDWRHHPHISFFAARVGGNSTRGDSPSLPYASAFEGAHVCFYVASADSRTLRYGDAYATNVRGALDCLQLAQKYHLRAFVLTSSHNVVCAFDRDLCGADEHTAPIPPRHRDVYSATKAEAERRILASDGGATGVRTCAIRPVGIYGPGERLHFDRNYQLAKYCGFHHVRLWPHRPQCMDWVQVASLADAHIWAAQALLTVSSASASSATAVAGRAFFISDAGGPVLVQGVFEPVLAAAGIPLPRWYVYVPWQLMYAFGWCMEMAARALADKPVLMRMEVLKAVRVHSFRYDAAAAAFGYRPRFRTADGLAHWAQRIRSGVVRLDTAAIGCDEVRRLWQQATWLLWMSLAALTLLYRVGHAVLKMA